jgi:hypothetical protein
MRMNQMIRRHVPEKHNIKVHYNPNWKNTNRKFVFVQVTLFYIHSPIRLYGISKAVRHNCIQDLQSIRNARPAVETPYIISTVKGSGKEVHFISVKKMKGRD